MYELGKKERLDVIQGIGHNEEHKK